mgnify:CR=1 FL=1
MNGIYYASPGQAFMIVKQNQLSYHVLWSSCYIYSQGYSLYFFYIFAHLWWFGVLDWVYWVSSWKVCGLWYGAFWVFFSGWGALYYHRRITLGENFAVCSVHITLKVILCSVNMDLKLLLLQILSYIIRWKIRGARNTTGFAVLMPRLGIYIHVCVCRCHQHCIKFGFKNLLCV